MWSILNASRFYIVAFCACLIATGCSSGVSIDYSKVELSEITGQVTLDGQPLSGAAIVFEAADSTFSYARTDESGNYTLMFNSEKTGVTLGEKIVRIRTAGGLGEAEDEAPEGEDSEEGEAEDSENAAPAKELVPACYHRKSQLSVNVTSSTTMDFHLKSDCSVKTSS